MHAMEIGGGAPVLFVVFVAVAVVFPSLAAAGGSAAAAAEPKPGGGRGPSSCFGACFDQCMARDEFWFCQFTCYRRCGADRAAVAAGTGAGAAGCEQSCVLTMCGQLRAGSKMMVACRDTCRRSYVAAACRGSSTDV
ncbi:hypothetical protein ACP70R_037266 [Stipagrostis hirtigluma subsp. patula]